LRLVDDRLRRVVDTADLYQSLLKDFLARRVEESADGQHAGGLCAYLARAVDYKIRTKLRKERHHGGGLPDGQEPLSPEAGAARMAEGRDFHQALRERLAEPVRRLFDLKAEGLTWPQIAEQIGGEPDALRMRLRRAVATILAKWDAGD
jgi:DNA-directed RNA polymerase specialized sigma24 family protein